MSGSSVTQLSVATECLAMAVAYEDWTFKGGTGGTAALSLGTAGQLRLLHDTLTQPDVVARPHVVKAIIMLLGTLYRCQTQEGRNEFMKQFSNLKIGLDLDNTVSSAVTQFRILGEL